MNNLAELRREVKSLADPKRAEASARYFKTGPGEYGEGDKFIGLNVPQQRSIAKKFQELSLADIAKLLKSRIHEERFIALEILVMQFEKAGEKLQKQIANFYLKNTKHINNWDLVDTSAPYILGEYLVTRPRKILTKLARSRILWERRIAIIAAMSFINRNDFTDTLRIAGILLNDEHDLIHKAVGWQIREVGNKDKKILRKFLKKHYQSMPRTMLRYAIEKFPEPERQRYLKGQA